MDDAGLAVEQAGAGEQEDAVAEAADRGAAIADPAQLSDQALADIGIRP